jgi:hypothetical protein
MSRSALEPLTLRIRRRTATHGQLVAHGSLVGNARTGEDQPVEHAPVSLATTIASVCG